MNIRASIDKDGFYVGTVECQESPLEPGVFLIPANSAPLPAHPPQKGQLLRFQNNKWETLTDHTGKYYFHKVTGIPKIFEKGEAFDESYTDKTPSENLYIRNIFCGLFLDNDWILDEEKKALVDKEYRIFQINEKLKEIDMKSIRPIRNNEIDRIVELENEAEILREELRNL